MAHKFTGDTPLRGVSGKLLQGNRRRFHGFSAREFRNQATYERGNQMNARRQWTTKDIMKGIVTVLICTGVLCFSILAEEESGPTSNVWLDVIQVPTQARISVTVPLSYGFAVIGSVESSAENPVSVADGNLLLPNVRVVVTEPSGTLPGAAGSAEYAIQTVSEASIPIRNYSTDVRDGDEDKEPLPREGLPVEARPYMVSVPDSTYGPHHWQPSKTDPTWDGMSTETNFKKFQMILDGLAFSVEGQKYIEDFNAIKDVLLLNGTFALAAPPDVPLYGYTSAGTAQVPSQKYLSVDVKVGGRQNQYKQVEESVKVGAIYWDIIPGELPAVVPPQP